MGRGRLSWPKVKVRCVSCGWTGKRQVLGKRCPKCEHWYPHGILKRTFSKQQRHDIAKEFGRLANRYFDMQKDELDIYRLVDHIKGAINLHAIERILQVRK